MRPAYGDQCRGRSEALGEPSGGIPYLTKVRDTELGQGTAGPGAAVADEFKREKQASTVPVSTGEEEDLA